MVDDAVKPNFKVGPAVSIAVHVVQRDHLSWGSAQRVNDECGIGGVLARWRLGVAVTAAPHANGIATPSECIGSARRLSRRHLPIHLISPIVGVHHHFKGALAIWTDLSGNETGRSQQTDPYEELERFGFHGGKIVHRPLHM